MRIIRKSLLTAAFLSSTAIASFAQSTPNADTVLATVNGTQITLGHVLALVSRLPEQYQQVDDATLFDGILDQLIQQSLLSTEADTSVKSVQIAKANEERAFLATVAIDQIVAENLTEDAIKAAYDEQFGNQPAEPEFNASHILVETEEEAKAIVEMIAGGADFAETAKEKSTGPSGPSGGQLGWFGKGAMVPEFEQAVIGLDKGAVSDPVQTQFGWHVVKLNDTRDKPAPTLADVRNDIEANLRRQIIEAEIERLEGASDVVRNAADIDPAIIRDTTLLD